MRRVWGQPEPPPLTAEELQRVEELTAEGFSLRYVPTGDVYFRDADGVLTASIVTHYERLDRRQLRRLAAVQSAAPTG